MLRVSPCCSELQIPDTDRPGRENARPPLLKAPARAGSEVRLYWTALTRMHTGPTIAYLGRLPTPDTPPQKVKFFKIWEKGFDASLGKSLKRNAAMQTS